MRIKKLFNNESEFLDFAWKFIKPDRDKIWRDEDLPLLEPFFNIQRSNSDWTDEEKKSFDYYLKCREEYNNELTEIRDSCSKVDLETLLDLFYLEYIQEWEVDDEGYEIEKVLTRNDLKISGEYKEEISFPMVFLAFIDSGWDRSGDYSLALSDFVTLKDFSNT